MTVALYLDHNIPAAVAKGLREREVDLLMAREDGHATATDEQVLERATELQRIVVTHDTDFFRLAAESQRTGRAFSGVVWCRQDALSVGELIEQLELFAQLSEPRECQQRILCLPL